MDDCACSKDQFERAASTSPSRRIQNRWHLPKSWHLPTGTRQFSSRKENAGEKEAYLVLHILGIVFPIYVATRCLTLHAQCCISDLNRQAVYKIKKAGLTHVLDFCAGLADDSRFEAHALTRIPPEYRERPIASATFTAILLFGLTKGSYEL